MTNRAALFAFALLALGIAWFETSATGSWPAHEAGSQKYIDVPRLMYDKDQARSQAELYLRTIPPKRQLPIRPIVTLMPSEQRPLGGAV